MKKIRFLFISWALVGASYFACADNQQIDTEHKYIAVGTVSAAELEKEYLETHHVQHTLDSSKEFRIPSYIKFTKLAPNPNYIPSNKAQVELKSTNYPSSRVLSLYTPPLDQGYYATCITMSVIGAYAAGTQNMTFAPSPSCVLQSLRTKGINAWDSYWINQLVANLKTDGWVSDAYARDGFCNQSYPVYLPSGSKDQKNATVASMDSYRATSMKLDSKNYHEQWFSDSNTALNYIKEELNNTSYATDVRGLPGWYPAFEFFDAYQYQYTSISLADGNYPVWADNGTALNPVDAHSVFAYGYDDDIVVNGQRGVLYLRNSWGYTGNKGNFLMTYDFFRKNFRTDDSIVSFPNTNRMIHVGLPM